MIGVEVAQNLLPAGYVVGSVEVATGAAVTAGLDVDEGHTHPPAMKRSNALAGVDVGNFLAVSSPNVSGRK